MPACNGFTTGGINELVILAYSSYKLVTVPQISIKLYCAELIRPYRKLFQSHTSYAEF